MNPYEYILTNLYGDDHYSDFSGMDAVAVLLLQIMADRYADDMPEAITCGDPYMWCLDQLDKYRPNEFIDWIERDWAQVCPALLSFGEHREGSRLAAYHGKPYCDEVGLAGGSKPERSQAEAEIDHALEVAPPWEAPSAGESEIP